MNSSAEAFRGTAIDSKTWDAVKSVYLSAFLSAAWSASSPAPVAAISAYDAANVGLLATVTSLLDTALLEWVSEDAVRAYTTPDSALS